jgi:chaperone required for assembly of F1-ATPase
MKNGSSTPAALPKRFYQAAAVEAAGDGWRVLLDGRAVKTPKRQGLLLPAKALAEAIAAEWNAQGTVINPAAMPLTRLANTTLDGVIGRKDAVHGEITAYTGNDLLCYRADQPEALAHLQAQAWDPLLAWARERFGAHLKTATGVMHVAQAPDSVARLGEAVALLDAFALAACHVMTTLTGSAVLALAHMHDRLTLEEAWKVAHIDEDFQIARWGEDAEEKKRRDLRFAEMTAASQFYSASRYAA